MNSRRLLPGILGTLLAAQAPEGRLTYAVAGRTVAFTVVGAGHKALVTLPTARGTEARGRLFVLVHSGPEHMIVPDAQGLKEKAPAAWKVSHRADRRMVRTAEATYWCYTPGLVLPVRFRLDGEDWALVSAELAPKMFVATPE